MISGRRMVPPMPSAGFALDHQLLTFDPVMSKPWWTPVLPLTIVAGVLGLVALAARNPIRHDLPEQMVVSPEDDTGVVRTVDQILLKGWQAAGVDPAEPVDELTVLRRLSLALHGSIPSLEEIRLFEADTGTNRLARWTERLLADRRFADYFAVRLSRVYVGADDGQFIVFRRDRFNAWLLDQLQEGRPYDQIVRDVISQQGLWTGMPATNFVTAAVAGDTIDRNELAGRTARAFLGQRIDCAQCHDFDESFSDFEKVSEWKQSQFEGLAACFGQAQVSVVGIEDNPKLSYEVDDRNTLKKRPVAAEVPFNEEWIPAEGTQRERLAAWITHPDNRRFERATVNRVWGLLFGRPWIEPVDDMPNPQPFSESDLLDVLGKDFREHNYDLKRLIGVITATRVFRLSSAHPAWETGENAEAVERAWAAFPMTRLRPEQIIGSMIQAATLKTVDRNSHLFLRTIRLFREIDFVKEYGDLGDNELTDRAGTIPQALLRMNGRFAQEMSQANPINASGRISAMAAGSDRCLELCYLVCLSRRPTAEEITVCKPSLEDIPDNQRSEAVGDIFWSLFNSEEFSWNH